MESGPGLAGFRSDTLDRGRDTAVSVWEGRQWREAAAGAAWGVKGEERPAEDGAARDLGGGFLASAGEATACLRLCGAAHVT
jgi:hypothetical protein